jgi:outer membrane lipoprotein SlyB
VQNRSLSLLAQSDVLRSNKRVSNNQLLQNSGIGAVAGAILGGLNGSVLGGAAAGAAITYAVSPKETLLQPGQVVQVKLVQDFFAGR